jgi:hypothetical protein
MDLGVPEIATGLKAVEKALKLLEAEQVVKRGTSSNQMAEKSGCAEIHVFMRCIGKATEKRRALLTPVSSVGDARKAFEAARGGPIRQEHTLDEEGYLFSEKLVREPLWKFSNNCRLNLDFTEHYTTTVQKEIETGFGLFGK